MVAEKGSGHFDESKESLICNLVLIISQACPAPVLKETRVSSFICYCWEVTDARSIYAAIRRQETLRWRSTALDGGQAGIAASGWGR